MTFLREPLSGTNGSDWLNCVALYQMLGVAVTLTRDCAGRMFIGHLCEAPRFSRRCVAQVMYPLELESDSGD